jgi:TonB family protein
MNWSFWFELLVRSAALLAAGEVLRRSSKALSADFRHKLLLWVLALLALLPLLAVVFPEIRVPLWSPARDPKALVTAFEISPHAIKRSSGHAVNWPLVIWLAGVCLASANLLAGAISAWRITRRGLPLDGALVTDALTLAPNAEILVSPDLSVPLTCGLWRCRILLPSAAESWSGARLRAVLLHELAHVRRRDVAAQVAGHLVAALWWFQPLAWLLRRSMRAESELACDAEVLRAGFRPSEYAAELLAVAKAMGHDHSLSSYAASMTRCSGLERRLRAILNPPRASLSPLKICALGLALAVIAVAASAVTIHSNQTSGETGDSMKKTLLSGLLTSVGLSAATLGGSIQDPAGAAISDAKVIVYNPDSGSKQETVTGADGKFSIAGAPAGQYILRVEKPGFTALFREFDLKTDSKMERQFTMTNEGGPAVADRSTSTAEAPTQPVRVGGQVAQSNLITKVQPVYPVAAKAAHTQGTVELDAVISKDGIPVELRVISSPSGDLSEASLEAVRQWRYRPTLLNGEPVEITTTIIVNFTLSS